MPAFQTRTKRASCGAVRRSRLILGKSVVALVSLHRMFKSFKLQFVHCSLGIANQVPGVKQEVQFTPVAVEHQLFLQHAQ